jgi:hypothetical protein
MGCDAIQSSNVHRSFGGKYCLYLQGRRVRQERNKNKHDLEGSVFLRKISEVLLDQTSPHPRRGYSSDKTKSAVIMITFYCYSS